MTEYPEPKGYNNWPGWVKYNPKNNELYLERSCEYYPQWAGILRDTHAKLLELDPNYNIAQIKAKFGRLRYYFDSECNIETSKAMIAIAHDAEASALILDLTATYADEPAQSPCS